MHVVSELEGENNWQPEQIHCNLHRFGTLNISVDGMVWYVMELH